MTKDIETLHLKLDADDMQKIKTEIMTEYEKISPEMHLSAIAEKLGMTGKMLGLFELEKSEIGDTHEYDKGDLVPYTQLITYGVK